MNGMEKITARMKEDVARSLSELNAQTEQELRRIREESAARAEKERETAGGRAHLAAQERYERLCSAAEMETRKMALAARQEVLGETYVRALDILCSMPREDYLALLIKLLRAAGELFDRIVDRRLLVRRMYLVAEHVLPEQDAQPAEEFCQLSLFSDAPETQPAQPPEEAARERSMQQTLLAIREKYGKDAVLKAMSLQDGATARTRFHQIGGHRA